MPTTEGYNGAYTGQQIDAAIAKANAALSAPAGGTAGQVLEKTADGTAWANKPVVYAVITGDPGSGYASDKTAKELYQAYEAGATITALYKPDSSFDTFYAAQLALISAVIEGSSEYYRAIFIASESALGAFITVNTEENETTVGLVNISTTAEDVSFDNFENGFTADNVQEAIEEVSSRNATITLTANGWTGDAAPFSQQVACSIVAADTPVVSVDAQTSGDPDANAEILNAWYLVSQKDPTQGAGTMTFYATEKPTVNIPVKVGVS